MLVFKGPAPADPILSWIAAIERNDWQQCYVSLAYPVVSASHNILWLIYGVQFGHILRAPYLFVGCGLASGSEAQQRLKRSHGCLTTIVAKYELIEIDLQLIAAHAMIGSNQPLL